MTRFGDDGVYRVESAKMLATLLHMMEGNTLCFPGDELGMKDVPLHHLIDIKILKQSLCVRK